MKVSPKKQLNNLIQGKHYLVIGIEADSYRIVDEVGEPYLYDSGAFKIIDPRESELWVSEIGEDGERYCYPKEWIKPGFFEDYFDNVPSAREVFIKVLSRSYAL